MARTHRLTGLKYLLVVLLLGCQGRHDRPRESIPGVQSPRNPQEERDLAYSLMSYALVYADWQTNRDPDESRGYNIGAVLVNSDGYVVSWGRNSVNEKRDGTRHAEVEAMETYLRDKPGSSLDGFTLYTTLEPCAMCAGMMVMTKVERVVYGQEDLLFGDVHERLQLDSRAGSVAVGFGPYERRVNVVKSTGPVTQALDSLYSGNLLDFLCSDNARAVFQEARRLFDGFEVHHHRNDAAIDSARRVFQVHPGQSRRSGRATRF